MKDLPSPAPRPEEETRRLQAAWRPPRGWRLITAVNNSYIGVYYVGVAMLFFVLAGVLALIIRIQLAVPDNDFVTQGTYNQVFTMHGTVMMFLFAVPAVEAMAVYLLPNMLAARDLPFPRLSAYAFWAYTVGGLAFFCSLFFGVAPDGGWFMYPPLTSYRFSPGINADLWLLGIGFIEISAIAGAIEIIVGVLRTRAPGMTLDRLPIYPWALLIFAVMIAVAFPAVILCTMLLEIERAFHWPFFIAEKGGDPLLWQHLFWFFGHPEVYIIFLPATGFVSTILPALCGVPLVGHRWVVLALITTGFISFGLWVHHMFATGIPRMSLSFFAAASMAVAIPSGIQVFAWIATLARGRLRWRSTPALFILGFLFIFVLGGLTGVMVAVVQFDWQAHDTYFVVAHFHYVLIGGMVFPLFAALYYWIPTTSRRPLSEPVGRWVFGLMFAGFNLGFFPMHISGLLGMPRRVWTYPAGMEWGWLNLLSTIGAFILAAGVLLFLIDMARLFRPFSRETGNIWGAGTLEWLPSDTYGVRSVPIIHGLYPLWEDRKLADDVQAGRYYLPASITGDRETLITSALRAEPQHVTRLPGYSWRPLLAAWFTAAFFLLLTVKMVVIAIVCGVLAVLFIIAWMWQTDAGPTHPPTDIGGGLVLPVYATGPSSHSWWAMVVLMLVSASLFACLVFSYFFLWTVSPDVWPSATGQSLPQWRWPALAAFAWLASSALLGIAGRALDQPWRHRSTLLVAVPLLIGGLAGSLWGHWDSGLRPSATAYGAVIYMFGVVQGLFVAALTVMALYTVARSLAGRLNAVHRVTFDNTRIFWHYAVAQGLVGLAVVHLAPLLL